MWPKKQWSNLVKMVWPYTLFKKFHLQKYTTTPYPPFTLPFICARSMPQSTVEKSLHKWGLVVFVILSLVISFNSLCSKYTVGARGRKMNCVSVQLKVHATYSIYTPEFKVYGRDQIPTLCFLWNKLKCFISIVLDVMVWVFCKISQSF